MKKDKGESQNPLAMSIEVERERAIETLSRQFAADNLTLDELERRMEQVYKAQTATAVRDVTRDLQGELSSAMVPRSAPATPAFVPETERVFSMMSQTVRRGVWQPARHLRVVSIMSETRLDLTEAMLQPGVTDIDLSCVMAQVRIIVPAGVRVVVDATSFMAEVTDDSLLPSPPGTGAPVVRITGWVVMAELKVSVRTREGYELVAPKD